MLNFRYHALSLIAVFLALAIGVVLGVAIGDKGVVSGARQNLERSLRGDVKNARQRNAELESQVKVRQRYEEQNFPTLVRGLIRGDRVGLLAIGNLPGGYESQVQGAVEPAGARLQSVIVVSSPLSLDRVSKDLGRSRLARLRRSDRQLERFGRAIGRDLGDGGGLPRRVRGSLFSSSSGGFGRLDSIVVVRDRDGLEGAEKKAADLFERGLIRGLKTSRATLVGVERQGTDPSQIGFFEDNDISTVNDINLVAGQAALVYVLAGRKGNYGTGAADLLPPRPRRR